MACVSPILVGRPGNTAWTGCGSCVPCLVNRSSAAQGRSLMEAHGHIASCCLTLTYDDDHLPGASVMGLLDVQKFVRSLRQRLLRDHRKADKRARRDFIGLGGLASDWVSSPSPRVKYVAVGEFGGATGRWHYHLMVFGWCPPELLTALGRSVLGQKAKPLQLHLAQWRHGHVFADLVSPASARYVHDYVAKGARDFTVRSQSNGLGSDVLRYLGARAAASGAEWVGLPRFLDFFGRNFPVTGLARQWLVQGYDAQRAAMGLPLLMGRDWPYQRSIDRIVAGTLRDDPDVKARQAEAAIRLNERVELKRLLKRKD